MSNPKQLPHLLKLLDDESPLVQEAVTKELLSFGASLEKELARLPEPPDAHQKQALRSLLEKHYRAKIRDAWPGWVRMKSGKNKLEVAYDLLAEFQSEMAYSVKLRVLLDQLGEEYDATHPERDALALANFLFDAKQLRGAQSDYYNPQNSNLAYVIQERRGIPISLVSIYILVGSRLGLDIEGCNFPGHFLARTSAAGKKVLVDCFDGVRLMGEKELADIKQTVSRDIRDMMETEADAEIMIARVLRNLIRAYDQTKEGMKRNLMRELLEHLEGERADRQPSEPSRNRGALRPRPRFRPGQLVQHKRYRYHGVVAHFDRQCQADDSWYLANRTQPERNQPWYHVFVHGSSSCTYAAEENLEEDRSGLPIQHPLLDHYFSEFKDGRYIRNNRPWGDA